MPPERRNGTGVELVTMDLSHALVAAFNNDTRLHDVRGFVTAGGAVIPLGTDTKVLSTLFEAIARPAVASVAEAQGYTVHEATMQNSYPDFTLAPATASGDKLIAVDVKTTYRANQAEKVKYTLGSYTSFLRTPEKGIEHHFDRYAEHWIMAFVYSRPATALDPAAVYSTQALEDVPQPVEDVRLLVRQKWELAGDKAGAGNTANIGSRAARFDELRSDEPLFENEAEFIAYWRGYGRTAEERKRTYRDLDGYRRWLQEPVEDPA